MTPMADKKPLPPWLIGLVFAAALAVIALWVFTLFGFGDNPVLESGVAGLSTVL